MGKPNIEQLIFILLETYKRVPLPLRSSTAGSSELRGWNIVNTLALADDDSISAKIVWKKKLGMSLKKAAAIITNDLELPLTADEYYSQVMELAAERLEDAELMSGVLELVQHFFKTNVPMAIATSSSADTWRLKTVKHVDFFNKYFSHVVTAASDVEVKQGKPAPDVFWVCAKRFPDSPSSSKCLVFEDAPNGIIGAKEAGMQTVLIPASYVRR